MSLKVMNKLLEHPAYKCKRNQIKLKIDKSNNHIWDFKWHTALH